MATARTIRERTAVATGDMHALGKVARYLGILLLAALSLPAQAGDWTLSNNLALQAFFSDNIDLTANGDSGMFLNVRPQVELTGAGRRVSGNLSYAPAVFVRQGDSAGSNGINHYLNAAFNHELSRQTLFLDTRASAGLVSTSAATNFGQDPLDNRDSTSQVFTLALSPYTRHRFGSQADLLFRLAGDWVQSDNNGSGLNSVATSAQLALTSGARFTRFPWSLDAVSSQTRYDDRTDRRDSVNASLGYRIDRRWRVDGTIGYQRNDILTSRSDTNGLAYSAKLFWTPTPRTSLQTQLGQSYFGTFWNLSGSHRSRRTTTTLHLSRDISNARSLANNQDFLERGILQIDQLNEDFLSTSVGFDLLVSGRRTDVSLGIQWDDRQYEVSNNDSQVLSLNMNASRRLTPKLTGNIHAGWQSVQTSLSDDSDYLTLRVGLSRTLGRFSQLGVDLSRSQRSSATLADFAEHRLGLTLTTRMF